jgi:hypothetical protein
MLMARAVLLLLALVLSPVAAAEADTQISGRGVALVIGNGGYRHVDRLANATNDARLIAGTLQKLGFTLMGNGPQLDLDRARLSEQVQQFGRALAGADVGLFYFSGHGLQVRGPVPALRDHPGEGTTRRDAVRCGVRPAAGGMPLGRVPIRREAPGPLSAERVTLAQITGCMLPQGDTSRGVARDEVVAKDFVTALMSHPGSKRPDIA